jgi:DNA-binding transcriptional ArsR family regulator
MERAKSQSGRVATHVEPRIHRMLAHPLRYAIFMRLGEGPATSAELADRLGESPKYISRQIGELLRENLVEVVEKRPNTRGGPSYRALDRYLWDADEWAQLPQLERESASVTICQTFNREMGGALAAGTFDAHPSRVLIRRPLWGDDQAAQEIDAIYRRADKEVAEAERRSVERNHSDQRPHRILTFLTSFLVSDEDRLHS